MPSGRASPREPGELTRGGHARSPPRPRAAWTEGRRSHPWRFLAPESDRAACAALSGTASGLPAGSAAVGDLQDARGHEDQQLGLLRLAALVAEQVAQHRDIAQPRHLAQVLAALELVDAADHHGLAIVHEHGGADLTLGDL